MLKHLKTELAAEWHKLVTGAENDCDSVADWIETQIEGLFMSTLEEIGVKLDTIVTKLEALVIPTPAATDLTPVLTAIADLKTEVVTKVEGTPAPAPTPAA